MLSIQAQMAASAPSARKMEMTNASSEEYSSMNMMQYLSNNSESMSVSGMDQLSMSISMTGMDQLSMTGIDIDQQSPLINLSLLPSPIRFLGNRVDVPTVGASSTVGSASPAESTSKLDEFEDRFPAHPFFEALNQSAQSTQTPVLPASVKALNFDRPMLAQRSKNPSLGVTAVTAPPTRTILSSRQVKQEESSHSHRLSQQIAQGKMKTTEQAVTVTAAAAVDMPEPPKHVEEKKAKAGSEQSYVDVVESEVCDEQCDEPEPPVVTRSIKKSEIRDIDILSHRGVASSQRKGNLRFRELVCEYKGAYDKNQCLDYRNALAKKIVDQLRPGRFLKLENDSYRIVDYQSSITKALFAMRDCKKKRQKKKRVSADLSPENLLPRKRMRKDRNIRSTSPASVKCSQTAKLSIKRILPKRKTVTPPRKTAPLPTYLTEAENRKIRSLIMEVIKNISSSSPILIPTNTSTRSEQIHAFIEKMVAKGADARKNAANDVIDEEWFHPEMQKCIRVQILNRCRIAMHSTGISHTEFFDRLFRLKIFP